MSTIIIPGGARLSVREAAPRYPAGAYSVSSRRTRGLRHCRPFRGTHQGRSAFRSLRFRTGQVLAPSAGFSRSLGEDGSDGRVHLRPAGEVAVSGNDVMLGYYRDEEATREVTRSGCFLTGDLSASSSVSCPRPPPAKSRRTSCATGLMSLRRAHERGDTAMSEPEESKPVAHWSVPRDGDGDARSVAACCWVSARPAARAASHCSGAMVARTGARNSSSISV